jgi:hypothetical protein
MYQSHFPLSDDITCENITDEIIASYGEKGFLLVFTEEVMRYDLSLAVPHMSPVPTTYYLLSHVGFAEYRGVLRRLSSCISRTTGLSRME